VDVFTINRKRAMCSTAPVAGTYPGVLWLPALTPMANVRPGCRQARSVNDTHVCDALHAQTSRQRSRRREKEETGESSDILQRRSGTQAETALANRYKRLSSTAASYACLKNDVSKKIIPVRENGVRVTSFARGRRRARQRALPRAPDACAQHFLRLT